MAKSISKKDIRLSRDDLNKQIKAFLKTGGKIQKIKSGSSGIESLKSTSSNTTNNTTK